MHESICFAINTSANLLICTVLFCLILTVKSNRNHNIILYKYTINRLTANLTLFLNLLSMLFTNEFALYLLADFDIRFMGEMALSW